MSEPIAPEADDELPQAPPDPGEFVVAGVAQDGIEAEILSRACEEAGIPALVDTARGGMVEKLSNPSEAWAIRVPAPRLDEARKLIADQREALEADPQAGERAAEAAEAEEATSDAAKA